VDEVIGRFDALERGSESCPVEKIAAAHVNLGADMRLEELRPAGQAPNSALLSLERSQQAPANVACRSG
jgi:hypothetical protein